jgi:hypothetical protein
MKKERQLENFHSLNHIKQKQCYKRSKDGGGEDVTQVIVTAYYDVLFE